MDHTFLPRSIWTGDSKFLQHPADLYSSVIVTRSIPAGMCFGPCVLQNTFYDTIAFIGQKSCDKRAKPYVFRVSRAIWGSADAQHGRLSFEGISRQLCFAISFVGVKSGDFTCVLNTRFVGSILFIYSFFQKLHIYLPHFFHVTIFLSFS